MPTKCHLNESWLGSFVIFRGSGPVLLGNPIFLLFFRGGGQGPLSLLWISPWDLQIKAWNQNWFYLPWTRNMLYILSMHFGHLKEMLKLMDKKTIHDFTHKFCLYTNYQLFCLKHWYIHKEVNIYAFSTRKKSHHCDKMFKGKNIICCCCCCCCCFFLQLNPHFFLPWSCFTMVAF